MVWCIKDNIRLSIDILNNLIFYLIYFEMAWLCKLLESVGWSAAASHQKSITTFSWQVKIIWEMKQLSTQQFLAAADQSKTCR